MASAFETATAVTRRPDSPGSRSVYDGAVADGWDIGGVANGGYVLALAARAMADTAGRPPLSVTAHYLAPGRPGPCVVEVEPVRIGRRMATVAARLAQGDTEVIRVLGTFGAPPAPDGEPIATVAPPADLPDYEHTPTMERFSPTMAPSGFPRQVEMRIRPGDEGFAVERPTGRAELAGWFALAGQAPGDAIDAIGLLLAADAFFPPVFNAGVTPGWVPTLELTVHIRAVPAPGPVAARFHSDVIAGGLLNEDGELWDSTGTLVAQSRQLALMPR
jgi:acyl-CoA thioesterase